MKFLTYIIALFLLINCTQNNAKVSSAKLFKVSEVIEENYYPTWLRDTAFISKANLYFSNEILDAKLSFLENKNFEIKIVNKTDDIIRLGGTGLISDNEGIILKYSPINNGKERFYEIVFHNFLEIKARKAEIFNFENNQIDLENSVLGINFKNKNIGVIQKLNKNNWVIFKVTN